MVRDGEGSGGHRLRRPRRALQVRAQALGYVVPPPPDGHPSSDDWYRSIGVPDEDLDLGDDRLVDPEGQGPTFWFQQVPEPKAVKNRLHIDIGVSGVCDVAIETRREIIRARPTRCSCSAPRSFDGTTRCTVTSR